MPNLPNRNECVGCMSCMLACHKNSISIEYDELGFKYPLINYDNCIDCKKCEKVCPLLMYKKIAGNTNAVYAAKSKNEQTRTQSSSGGVFPEIAKYILQQKGEVYGASYDKYNNVKHTCITTIEQLESIVGAKYAESDLGDTFKKIKQSLDFEKIVLFSGTPCQVAGLKSFLKNEYTNLFCVDFICHGIPSPAIWKEYLCYIEKEYFENKKISFINMRDKSSGWSHYNYSHHFSVKYKSDKYICNAESVYMKLFVENYINRQSCSSCKFKINNHKSDITLGDFWGIWDIHPDFDDNKGVSAVIIHTLNGNYLFNGIKRNLSLISSSVEEVAQQNPSLSKSSIENPDRIYMINRINKKGFKSIIERKSVSSRIKYFFSRKLIPKK